MEQAVDRRVYTMAEAARELRLGDSKFRQLCQGSAIRTVRVGRRVLVPASEIERFLAGDRQPAAAAR